MPRQKREKRQIQDQQNWAKHSNKHWGITIKVCVVLVSLAGITTRKLIYYYTCEEVKEIKNYAARLVRADRSISGFPKVYLKLFFCQRSYNVICTGSRE